MITVRKVTRSPTAVMPGWPVVIRGGRLEHARAEAEAEPSRLSSDHVRPSPAVDHRAG
jgi:hypothetical protein